jgi:hypothetical protein
MKGLRFWYFWIVASGKEPDDTISIIVFSIDVTVYEVVDASH